MGAFFSYSLQSALCLAVFYLFYTVVLSRETFHRLNRCMLLFIMALSWIIPFSPVRCRSVQARRSCRKCSLSNRSQLLPREAPRPHWICLSGSLSLCRSLRYISSASPFAYFIRLCLTYGYGDCSLKGNTRRWIMISG